MLTITVWKLCGRDWSIFQNLSKWWSNFQTNSVWKQWYWYWHPILLISHMASSPAVSSHSPTVIKTSHRNATLHGLLVVTSSCYLASSQAGELRGGYGFLVETIGTVAPAGWTGNSWHWKEDSESVRNLADVVLDHADDIRERMGMEGTEVDADGPKNSNCHEDGKTIAGCSKLWIPQTSPCFIRNAGHGGSLERCCQGRFVQKDTFWRGSQLIGCPHIVTSEVSMLRHND